MKENKKKVTIQDIANEAGIAASSVSRALNNNPNISIETKQKVWEIAKKLGYQSNNFNFSPPRNKNILFLVDKLAKLSDLEVIEHIQKKLKYNHLIKLISSDDLLDNKFNNFILQYNIDGIVSFIDYSDDWNEKFREITNLNIPIISLSPSVFSQASFNIVIDYFQAITLINTHFIKRKASRILLIRGNENNPFYDTIEEAFFIANETHKQINFECLKTNLNHINLKYEIEKRLDSLDSIITPNHQVALLVYQILKHKQKLIPDDIMLVSLEHQNNILIDPKITSIQFDLNQVTESVAKHIKSLFQSKVADKTITIIQTKLDIKPSSMRIV